jgi:hypothetical protein
MRGYNRDVKKAILWGAVALLAACSHDIQNKEAVRQGVMDSLNARAAETGLNMDQMQVDVTSVAFEKDQARATVVFRVKGAAEQAPVRVDYVLDRKGNKWVNARPVSQSGVSPHGGGQQPPMQPTQPPAGGNLPPGHPPLGKQ